MTQSKEYKFSDAFQRKILREIKAGKKLIKDGWEGNLPADIHTLESVLQWYRNFKWQARPGSKE